MFLESFGPLSMPKQKILKLDLVSGPYHKWAIP